ncbi:hypothetical protein [Subtercola frigoramans]|uniref:Uncharacterized protein n=1 Tax=Subtercola frigoramans TaxID=120298 RepID=A0ABS2L9Q2_9MICO|nr:hypothetical protein [Subtercola frigoramans]MBM7473601.1 hypothetical protein [Subtercola frigoramans]
MLADEPSAGHSSDNNSSPGRVGVSGAGLGRIAGSATGIVGEPSPGGPRSEARPDEEAQRAELRRAVFRPGTPDDLREQKAAELAALEQAIDDERYAAGLRESTASAEAARRRDHTRSLRRKWVLLSLGIVVAVLAVVAVTSMLFAGRTQPRTLAASDVSASDAAASTFPALSPAEAEAQSPAQIFARPQTSADMPTQGFPVGLVISSFRLLRTSQFTPTTAFVALGPDGDTCLTVYGTGTDFESKCTLAETALRGGITVVFSTVQNMNPRTGSTAVSSVTFTAEWMPDGQYTVSSAITVAH